MNFDVCKHFSTWGNKIWYLTFYCFVFYNETIIDITWDILIKIIMCRWKMVWVLNDILN